MSSRARRCIAADCDREVSRKARGALFCPEHEHDWVAAGEFPLEMNQVSSAARRSSVKVEEETWIVVRDVYCAQCRQPYSQVKELPCDPFAPVLRGGPQGVRRRRELTDEEIELMGGVQ